MYFIYIICILHACLLTELGKGAIEDGENKYEYTYTYIYDMMI